MSFLTYLFSPEPGKDFLYYYPMLGLAATLIIGSIVASIIYKKRKKHDYAYKRLFKNLSTRLVTLGLIFIVLTAVRYENIPYFAMRLWIYLSLLLLAYFAYKYIKTARVDYPREKTNVKTNLRKVDTKKEENRYLPNKKK